MFKVLNLSNCLEWINIINEFPLELKSIYLTPQFFRLFNKINGGEVVCLLYTESSNKAIYPFYKSKIDTKYYDLNDEYYDIEGPYGYNGPIANTLDKIFLKKFSELVVEYFCKSNIVCEFIRFNPILENFKYALWMEPEFVFKNISIYLNQNYEEIWSKSYDKGTRKAIRKAQRSNLLFEFYFGKEVNESHIFDFRYIYESTLKRNNARDYYFFENSFYFNLFKIFPKSSLLLFVKYEHCPISTEIILFDKYIAYSYLGGTLKDYYSLCPNSFLRDETVKLLKSMGIHYNNLGGGSESIINYKRNFSLNCNQKFYIGKKIYNKFIYNKIVEQWEKRNPEKSLNFKNILLKYQYY